MVMALPPTIYSDIMTKVSDRDSLFCPILKPRRQATIARGCNNE